MNTNMSRVFIERPVMTTLVMAALVIFGVFGYFSLAVSDLPNFDFPTITVSATLPGANPETMAAAVASPLETQLSRVTGIDSMTSNSIQGTTTIAIQFDLDRDIDNAAEDVQAAITAAGRQLPKNMPAPPIFKKSNPADQGIIFIAFSSDTLNPTQMDEYAETMLARQISTLAGVASVEVGGSTKAAVRIQADPSALAARNIGFDTLQSAVAGANVDQATGALNGDTHSQIIQADGQLTKAGDYARQIFAYRNGAPVRIGDVAHVIDGLDNPYAKSWFNGKPVIMLVIKRQPGSNTVEVINKIKDVLPKFAQSLPPSVKLAVIYDRSRVIEAAIDDVQWTLVVAGILVVLVIFAFLRRLSATIIPSLALPIAIIATFAGMAAFGFSLDNFSLMALTLSVGFVVDDAIVMLENIVRHIEQGMKPYEAAIKGSGEIGFTILSMTVSLAAVFIPLVFMGGIVGRLLHEFAVTIVLAIICSGIVSVTLTPMLCARLLKSEEGQSHGTIYRALESAFDWQQRGYERSLLWAMSHRRFILFLFFGSIAATVALFAVMQQDFLPSDDIGRLQGTMQTANGTSYEQMNRIVQRVQAVLMSDPNVTGVNINIAGDNGTAGVNAANIQSVNLTPPGSRKLSADDIVHELRPKLNRIPGVNVFINNQLPVRFGSRQGRSTYQYTLTGLDLNELADASNRLTEELKSDPAFVEVNSDFDSSVSSVHVEIDRDRAAAMGVSVAQIENALGSAFSSSQISQINAPSNQYRVILELLPKYQREVTALAQIYITSTSGTLVPLTAVTKITNGSMPVSINHTGQVPSITISFDMAAGMALSDAVTGIEKAQEAINMPGDITGSFAGTAAAFQQSTQNIGLLLLVALIVVYIILGILYESFIHPFTILSGLPSAAMGALLTLYIFGLPLTLYAFVGMIMLIGIVKKNAIMMIDFALERQRHDGALPEKAIYEAAITRFRPIMMTTVAALMGTLPIALGVGMGAASRRPLGLGVVGGLLLSQLLTLYITPVIYVYMDRLSTQLSGAKRKKASPAPAPAE